MKASLPDDPKRWTTEDVAACIAQGRPPALASIRSARYELMATLVTHNPHTGAPLDRPGKEHHVKETHYECVFASGAVVWLKNELVGKNYHGAILHFRETWSLADWVEANAGRIPPDGVVLGWLKDASSKRPNQASTRTDGALPMTIDCLAYPFKEDTPHYSCIFTIAPAQPVTVALNLRYPPPPPRPDAGEGVKRRRLLPGSPPARPCAREPCVVEGVRLRAAPTRCRTFRVSVPIEYIVNSRFEAYKQEALRFEQEYEEPDASWDKYEED